MASIPNEVAIPLRRVANRAGIGAVPMLGSSILGYRHRARLSIRGRSASPKVGIFQSGSHRIVDIPQCGVHHPLVNSCAAAVKRAIRATRVSPYADRPHRGEVRGLQVVVERKSQTAQVVVIGNSKQTGPLDALLDALSERLGESLHSLWWNGNPERTNTILGPHWQRRRGAETVCESVGGASIYFPPGAFGQSHLDLADDIVTRIHGWTPEGASVAELYAGCGSIGLGLVTRGHRVAFNELNPAGLEGLQRGIRALDPSMQERATVRPGPASDCIAMLTEADIVIADPPRRGLDAEVLEALCEQPPQRFVYLSCDPVSFVRDADAILDSKALRLAAIETYLLFPHTAHVETLALFEKR